MIQSACRVTCRAATAAGMYLAGITVLASPATFAPIRNCAWGILDAQHGRIVGVDGHMLFAPIRLPPHLAALGGTALYWTFTGYRHRFVTACLFFKSNDEQEVRAWARRLSTHLPQSPAANHGVIQLHGTYVMNRPLHAWEATSGLAVVHWGLISMLWLGSGGCSQIASGHTDPDTAAFIRAECERGSPVARESRIVMFSYTCALKDQSKPVANP